MVHNVDSTFTLTSTVEVLKSTEMNKSLDSKGRNLNPNRDSADKLS